jgi:hypothetical protein
MENGVTYGYYWAWDTQAAVVKDSLITETIGQWPEWDYRGTFVDLGICVHRHRDENLGRMLDLIEDESRLVVPTAIDLAEALHERYWIARRLDKKGCQLWIIEGGITNPKDDVTVIKAFEALDFYSDRMHSLIRKYATKKRYSKEPTTLGAPGTAKYGMKKDPETGKFTEHIHEQAVLKDIKTMHLQHMTPVVISAKLNASRKFRRGKVWTGRKVQEAISTLAGDDAEIIVTSDIPHEGYTPKSLRNTPQTPTETA